MVGSSPIKEGELGPPYKEDQLGWYRGETPSLGTGFLIFLGRGDTAL